MKFFILLCCLLYIPTTFATIVLEEENTVSIASVIGGTSTAQAAQELSDKCRKLDDDLYLVLYSPGGSVSAGRLFIDFVKSLPCKVHTVAIFAASMAYQIVQSLDTRYALPSSTLMSHRAALDGLGGQLPGELLTRLGYYMNMILEVEVATAKRIGIPLQQYQKEIYDELWLSGQQALERNHVDKIEPIRCGESLSGTKDIFMQVMFMGTVKVTISKCPLIVGALNVSKAEAKSEIERFFNPRQVETGYEY